MIGPPLWSGIHELDARYPCKQFTLLMQVGRSIRSRMDAADALRYPIGRFTFPSSPLDAKARAACIDSIARTPAEMRGLVSGLAEADLDEPYRPGGWTIRQVVHHVPESHMHSFLRLKFALTEETPLVKAYDENVWS